MILPTPEREERESHVLENERGKRPETLSVKALGWAGKTRKRENH